MDIRAEKIWLIDQITKIKDERLLQALKSLLEFAHQQPHATTNSHDFWEELSEAQKEQIQKSIKQLDNGEGIPHETVISEFRSKYKRR